MNCESVTIFEGADGSGKTTIAKEVAKQLGARYVHLPAFPRVSSGLARLYVEAMLPALLGYQPVVMDRSWLSEAIYGLTYRQGADRLGNVQRRMLERLAMRCGAVVVRCETDLERMKGNVAQRLEAAGAVGSKLDLTAVVADGYRHLETALPVIDYDYADSPWKTHKLIELAASMNDVHPLDLRTAGSWRAKICLVGEAFGEVKNHDPLYQWPFASFSGAGCSHWLTNELADISERELLWVNADQLTQADYFIFINRDLIALGGKAHDKLNNLELDHQTIPHPQHFKRFRSSGQYPLVGAIKEMLR